MKVPPETQHLCEQYLSKVKQNDQHQLTNDERLELYQKFGFSRILTTAVSDSPVFTYTKADFALSWLAFLTAKKVAFICKRGPIDPYGLSEADEVKEILRTVEGYLNKRITREEAVNVSQEYWYFFRPHLNYDVFSAWRASMSTLSFILHGVQLQITLSGFDHFVLDAIEAYSVIDRNLPGEGDSLEPPVPLEYDIGKRLKFWEWWLTEGMTQAWELVNDLTV